MFVQKCLVRWLYVTTLTINDKYILALQMSRVAEIILKKVYVLTPCYNRPGETVLISGHNIYSTAKETRKLVTLKLIKIKIC